MAATAEQVDQDVRPAPGQFLQDPASGTVVIILTAPSSPGSLRCADVPMTPARPLPRSYHPETGVGEALQPGYRYGDPVTGLEVRCLRGGGFLSYGHRTLARYQERAANPGLADAIA